MVLQKVHLVDVEEAAVGAGQQARLERLLAADQRALQVERADHAVLGGAERQVHDRNRRGPPLRRVIARAALLAPRGRGVRVAAVAATGVDLHRRQQGGERADGGRFAGAAVAEHQDAADRGIDGGDEETELHLLLAHDGGEREDGAHCPVGPSWRGVGMITLRPRRATARGGGASISR